MKKILLFILLFIGISHASYAQEGTKTLSGTVSFITSNNVYVKFDSTEEVKIGDFIELNGNNCLKVTDKSSSSVVCTIENACVIEKGDVVTYTFSKQPEEEATEEPADEVVIPAETDNVPTTPSEEKEETYKEQIRGRIAASSYNAFSNLREDRHRLMTRFSLNANHIGDSKFSAETFMAYRNIITSAESNYTGRTSIFNVYNLNLRFDATESLSITAGRKINRKASSVGAVDGLQVEKYFGNFYVGAMGGFRPDFQDYGFNADLLQYGGYFGIETKSKEFFSETTLGAMEQTNAGNTDRRYIFFQHSSTIGNDLNLFSSMELDIFGNTGNETRLTNLYLSARYRFGRAVNVMVSYDTRKRIIYYETFETEIERLLAEDLARQGLRARINIRPFKRILAGFSYSSRFQSDNQNKSDNIYGYATLTKIPGIGGRLNASYNINSSNYLTSNILSVRHSRGVFKDKLQTEFYYRLANYEYENRITNFSQNYFGTVLSYNISKTWQFSISGELAQFEEENNYRFYTRLTKRFY
ncbi:hypothetical protein [Candidatus Ulvibacter alkanivorans]|uniref:hypothetical protein n=1 Tax=Candidatus Ulvibacter alkanivorans TaxID=2267620 RepID=UPI000DF411DA|nr:hypothetical protein [Candidatus Ulvibacter alkanivorans]